MREDYSYTNIHRSLHPDSHSYRWVNWSNEDWKQGPMFDITAEDSNQGSKVRSSSATAPQRHSATAPQRHSATAPQRHSATALQHSVMSMGDKSTSTLVLSLTPSCVWSLSVYNNKWTKGQFRTWWRRYICSGIDSKSLFWRVVEYFRVFGARYASTQRENIRVMLQWRLLPVLGYDDA